MQLLISMISKNISKSRLSFTLPRQSEGATASSIRDGYFPFSLSSILTLGTSLVASSLSVLTFFFFQERIVVILRAIRKIHSLVIAIAKCQPANIFPIRARCSICLEMS